MNGSLQAWIVHEGDEADHLVEQARVNEQEENDSVFINERR